MPEWRQPLKYQANGEKRTAKGCGKNLSQVRGQSRPGFNFGIPVCAIYPFESYSVVGETPTTSTICKIQSKRVRHRMPVRHRHERTGGYAGSCNDMNVPLNSGPITQHPTPAHQDMPLQAYLIWRIANSEQRKAATLANGFMTFIRL